MQPSSKNLSLLAVAVSSAMALSACSNGNSVKKGQPITPTQPPKNEVKIDVTDKVTILKPDVNKDIVTSNITDDNKMALTVNNPQSELFNKKVGDIVFLPPKNEKDLGIFVKITDVKKDKDNTTVVVEMAEATDTFKHIEMNIEEQPIKIVQVFSPDENAVIQFNKQLQGGLQAGLNTTDSSSQLSGGISYQIRKPKSKYKNEKKDVYKQYFIHCNNTPALMKDYQISQAEAENKQKEMCTDVIKLSADLTLNTGKTVMEMTVDNIANQLIFKKGEPVEIGLKDFFVEAKLKGEGKGEVSISDLEIASHIYAKKMFADLDKTSINARVANLSLLGLSDDDKVGKIPLFGFAYVPATTGMRFTGASRTAVDYASLGGGIIAVYAIYDMSGKIELVAELVYHSGKKSMGITYDKHKFEPMKSSDDGARADLTIQGTAEAKKTMGLAVELDAMVGGVRVANVGGGAKGGLDFKMNGLWSYNFLNSQSQYSGCMKAGIGGGLLTYINSSIGAEADVNLGVFKASAKGDTKFSYMYPTEENQTDPKFSSSIWKYWTITGTKDKPEVCITNSPANFKIEKVDIDYNNATLTHVPVQVKVKVEEKDNAGIVYSTPKSWKIRFGQANKTLLTLSKSNEQDYTWSDAVDVVVDDDGNVSIPKVINQQMQVAYGKSAVQVIAIDHKGRESKQIFAVDTKAKVQPATITSISTLPTALNVNQPFELIITGKNLPTDRMLTVNGCTTQTKVSLAVDKHIYKCTAPATATDNYNLSVVGTDGKTTIFNKQFKVTATTLPPITPTATKLTATGITLCGDDSRNNIACNSLSSAWLGLMQDGEVQAGQKMDYEKRIYNNKEECVIDKVTGLTWEQKTDDGGLRDKDNTYTWYNPDNRTNGGNAGKQNNGKNTHEYIKQLNASNYCGYNNWRLPTKNELRSIADYGRYNPAIHPIFSNTQSSFYWSSSPYANYYSVAWGVFFDAGYDYYLYKYYSYYVRAVRSN